MKNKFMLIVGIIILALGTYLIQQSSSKENSEKIKELEETLSIKNEQIKKQTEIINANITGGNSYCFLSIGPITNTKYTAVLLHEGDYTIKNVKVIITDEVKRLKDSAKLHSERGKYEGGDFGDYFVEAFAINQRYDREYIIGHMISNTRKNVYSGHYNTHLETYVLEDKNTIIHLRISIYGDNGLYFQQYKLFTLENGRQVWADQLKNQNGEIIKEFATDHYPKDENGEIIW